MNASFTLDTDLFRYDLVDITKEVLQYKFAGVYYQLKAAYNRKDLTDVRLVFVILNFNANNLNYLAHKLLCSLIF